MDTIGDRGKKNQADTDNYHIFSHVETRKNMKAYSF